MRRSQAWSDAATTAAQPHVVPDYAAGLDAGALRGARIGVLRSSFGFHSDVDRLMDDALRVLRDAGAVLVDPVKIATIGKFDATENDVLQYELKADLNAYLAERMRGVDVGAKFEIYTIINQLVADGKGVLLISSELPEVLGMSDRIYVMSEGQIVGEMTRGEASQERIMREIVRLEEVGTHE